MIKSLRSPQNETVCLFRSRGQGKKFQEHTVCTKEINFGGKANGNGVDPSGVNRELSASSKTQSTVHIWERTWTSQFCFPSSQPQACSLLRLFHCSDLLQLQGLKLSCFSSPQCNVFVFIFHRYLPYLHRCKSHFLNLLFTLWLWVSWFLSSSLLIMGLWHSLASYTNICLEGSRLGATLNLQTSICWSPMLKLIIS